MRRLYLSNILSKITYACTVWFVRSSEGEIASRRALSQELIHRLEMLQKACLIKVLGEFRDTVYEVLLEELHIMPLKHILHRLATIQRIKLLDSGLYRYMIAMGQSEPSGFEASLYGTFMDLAAAFKISLPQKVVETILQVLGAIPPDLD
jgi:hypothetical protein